MSLVDLHERNRDVVELIVLELMLDDLVHLCQIDKKANRVFNNYDLWKIVWKNTLSDNVPETVNKMKDKYLKVEKLVKSDIRGIFPPIVFRHYFSAGFEKQIVSHFYLLERDSSPNAGHLYAECLGLAVNRKDYRMLRELVKYKRFPFLSDSVLFRAIEMESLEAVQILVDNGAPLNGFRIYFPPLSSAVQVNNIHIVKYLLEKGAKTGLEQGENISALEYALYGKNKDIIKLLVTYGANPDKLLGASRIKYFEWLKDGN